MRRLLAAISLSLIAALGHAGVYKWVDGEGNVTYSDRPQPGAEEITVPSVQTYEAPALPVPAAPVTEAPGFAGYTEFAVVSPLEDETFRDNSGYVPISLKISPGLQARHTISIFMDGRDLGGNGRSTSLTLQNVDRGSHTVYATVRDESGKQVARTDPVTFHLHRTSKLIPPPRNPPPPPGGGNP